MPARCPASRPVPGNALMRGSWPGQRAARLWRRALAVSERAVAAGALVPLRTERVPHPSSAPFVLRRLLSSTPKHLRAGGPKPNPFLPWEPLLQVELLGESHVVVGLRHPHPETAVVAEAATMAVGPLSHGAFVRLLERADVVLTDSGGVQEECVALGRRALVLREETERPEGVASGHLVLVGTDVGRIVAGVVGDAAAVGVGACPYGEGASGEAIAAVLLVD